jgi:ribosomal protein S17E
VILDFKEQKVVLCSVSGITAKKDWNTIVGYYYPFYPAIMERLFKENGHPIDIKANS